MEIVDVTRDGYELDMFISMDIEKLIKNVIQPIQERYGIKIRNIAENDNDRYHFYIKLSKDNWKNEISKFTPDLKALKYTGTDRAEKFERIYDSDIVLTTYGTVRKDIDKLKDINFYYLILDESQYIKNPSSKIYQAVNNLSSQKKIVLTGTPIENSISDLWAQLNFLNQGLLSNYNFFKREFILPVEKYNNEEKEKKLFNIIKPFFFSFNFKCRITLSTLFNDT